MKDYLGITFACLGLFLILGGLTYVAYIIHPICAILFIGVMLIIFGMTIDSDDICGI